MPPAETPFEIWKEYEQIAMHFNSLLIQFRLQLLGGAGVIGTVATYLIGGKVEDRVQRDWLRTLIAAGLFVLMATAAILDLAYYNLLLRGAVDAIIELEKSMPNVQMSSMIEARVGYGQAAPYFSYFVVLISLAWFARWSYYDYIKTEQAEAARKVREAEDAKSRSLQERPTEALQ